MYTELFTQTYTKIKESENILLVSHHKPDIDTVAATCAFAEMLNDSDKHYTLYCQDNIPKQFHFLSNANNYTNQILDFDQYDLIITFDCGSISRTGIPEYILNKNQDQTIINFDHHKKIDNYADIELRNELAIATNEIIYSFFEKNNLNVTPSIAKCILSGLITDSGIFLFPRTNPKNLRMAANLLKIYPNWQNLINQIYKNKTTSGLLMWGNILKNLDYNTKYDIGIARIYKNQYLSIDPEEIEGLPNLLSTLSNIKGSILIKKQENSIRGSLRSNHNKIDISLLANALNGGGHAKTAGFEIEIKQ